MKHTWNEKNTTCAIERVKEEFRLDPTPEQVAAGELGTLTTQDKWYCTMTQDGSEQRTGAVSQAQVEGFFAQHKINITKPILKKVGL